MHTHSTPSIGDTHNTAQRRPGNNDLTWPVRSGDPAPHPPSPFRESELFGMWGGRTDPVVSVLCPTFNHQQYLSNALDGCLGQLTDFPIEIIVRDDASNDGTTEIVRRYAEMYPRIVRPIFEPVNTWSQGVSPRCAMMALAKGRVIALCDGDDYWISPHKLAMQVAILERDPSAAAVHHELCSVRDGAVLDCPVNIEEARRTLSPIALARGVMAIPSALCFRREAVGFGAHEYGMLDNGDSLLFTQLSRSGRSVYLPEVMGVYRVHDSSMWSSKSERYKNDQSLNSFLWISHYHFRTGAPAIGRQYALWAGLKIQARLAACGPRVAAWTIVAIVGKWLKTLFGIRRKR